VTDAACCGTTDAPAYTGIDWEGDAVTADDAGVITLAATGVMLSRADSANNPSVSCRQASLTGDVSCSSASIIVPNAAECISYETNLQTLQLLLLLLSFTMPLFGLSTVRPVKRTTITIAGRVLLQTLVRKNSESKKVSM